MPNTREKLIELLREVQYLGGLVEKIADHLIAYGVTIPVRSNGCTRAENHGAQHEVYCNLICAYMGNDDFCSYGERRNDDA